MPDAAADRSREDQVPQLVPGWEEKASVLSTEEGFLLSRIDGETSWAGLRAVSGVDSERVDECIERWLQDGAVTLETSARPKGRALAACDASIDLSPELQERILAFEKRLDRPYHALLGVSQDADAREIKRAYFKLSKDFHPDRYFGRELGDFGPRLDRIFKKIALAYELLQDPSTRTELARSLAGRPQGASGSGQSDKRRWLERMRRQFQIPEEILAERKFRARQLCESALVAGHQKNWKEAAACIRLAIAFDPWTETYKESFGEIQVEVNRQRAEELLSEADGAWDASSRSEALALYDEVLHYRPADDQAHGRAAQLAIELEEFERALEYAERACELSPDTAAHHFTRGRALRRQGLRKKAIEAFDAARRLDPDDPRAQQEIRKLRQRSERTPGGNS